MNLIKMFRRLVIKLNKGSAGRLTYTHKYGDASSLIEEIILEGKPAMIGRFGSTELDSVKTYVIKISSFSFIKKFWLYITGSITSSDYSDSQKKSMQNLSGFFPATEETLDEFSKLMLKSAKQVDVLGGWCSGEMLLKSHLEKSSVVPLGSLEPYVHSVPWSRALKGKKILVIHPFEESIVMQYEKRELLFEDKNVLPDFELQTIKAVQSLGGKASGFFSWFDAYNTMCRKIDSREFDIAIIGAGAYGFPLAAHIKGIGKIAIHLGGATQLLFGIKGKRWENNPAINKIFNEHWIRPSKSETPTNANSVEGGCYW